LGRILILRPCPDGYSTVRAWSCGLADTVEAVPYALPAGQAESRTITRAAAGVIAPASSPKALSAARGPKDSAPIWTLVKADSEKLLSGAASVVVDVVPSRLEKALAIGADAVIKSAEEDVSARLTELHGTGSTAMRAPRAGTDIYLDAAGVPAVIEAALLAAKHKAVLGIVAVHKKPFSIDFGAILASEVTIVMSMEYLREIFEVTQEIIDNWERFALIISDRFSSATASTLPTPRRHSLPPVHQDERTRW
jgi:hypothetical protein